MNRMCIIIILSPIMTRYEITAICWDEDEELVSMLGDEDGKEKEKYPFAGLKIYNETTELIMGFNKSNLPRIVPYFIYCLNNDKQYSMRVCDCTYINIYDEFIEFSIDYDLKWNMSSSSIRIAKCHCIQQLITEISKAGYEESDNYNKFMNAIHYNNYPSAYLFMRGPLTVTNDTQTKVIDELTKEEENKFRQLLISDGEVTIRGIIYKIKNDDFMSIDKTTGGEYTYISGKQILIDAVDHIY